MLKWKRLKEEGLTGLALLVLGAGLLLLTSLAEAKSPQKTRESGRAAVGQIPPGLDHLDCGLYRVHGRFIKLGEPRLGTGSRLFQKGRIEIYAGTTRR